MSALSLSAVCGLLWESSIAFSADHFLTLVLSGKGSEGWLDLDFSSTTTSKSEDQMESGLLLDVIVGKGSSVFQLLSSEDESLLIGGNTLLILNLGSM